MTRTTLATSIIACLGLCVTMATAAVTEQEAAQLKTTLTPLGAERAGNKEGTIPPWEGGWPLTPPQPNGRVPDLFGSDKPLFTITAQNVGQYADKLSEGQKELFKRFPTYRMVVYPTRRTAAAPQWVYDNTFKNATRAKLNPGGDLGPFPEGAFGGTPFPIPKTGEEAIWNHNLKWMGEAFVNYGEQARITPEGRLTVVQQARGMVQFPYYDSESNYEKWEAAGSETIVRRIETLGPPIRTGEMLVTRIRIDDSKSLGYVYLTGQRRVRRLPLVCCDVPSPIAGGIANFDEGGEVFSGSIGRYDWKLVGKREMYVPYNSNKFAQPKLLSEVLAVPFPNPELIRYELHRVWVVDATLKPGARHVTPKLRVYLDEDTWMGLSADRWDAQGVLWKTSFPVPAAFPSLPGLISIGFVFHDFTRGGYFGGSYNVAQEKQFKLGKPQPDRLFTPEAMSADGVR